MKRLDSRRMAGYGVLLLALVVGAVVAVATASAAPNKPYTANVHQTLNTAGSFTFTLANDPKASQQLGSANFTPPAGITLTPGTVGTNVTHAGWTATVDSAGILEFRSASTAYGLGPGDSVSADVTFSTNAACTPAPASATWLVEAKQSNNFSGAPGNDLTLNPASDLTPLGSFVMAPIETVKSGIHVPQITTGVAAPINVTAYDTCGNVDADYSGPTSYTTLSGLTNAVFTQPTWSGTGSSSGATLTPQNVEPMDQFKLTDIASGISVTSSSTPGPGSTFDVVQTICAGAGTVCTWKDPKKPITTTSTVPTGGSGSASLGLGYRSFANGTTCGAASNPVGDAVQINPYQYSGTYIVTIVYDKSLVGSGPASSLIVCKNLDPNLAADQWTQLATCPNTPVAPCATVSKSPGGNFQATLYLNPGDPGAGGLK